MLRYVVISNNNTFCDKKCIAFSRIKKIIHTKVSLTDIMTSRKYKKNTHTFIVAYLQKYFMAFIQLERNNINTNLIKIV